MDWGLGHFHLSSNSGSRKGGGGERSPSSRLRHWGLRPTLLFGSAGSYYAAIGLDLVLRLVWVLKYVEFDHRLSYDKFMLLIEGLEVLRRGVWSIYRIEWECLNLTGGRKVEGGGGISMVGVGGGGGKGGLVGGGGGVGGGKGVGGHDSDEDVDLERSSGVDEDEDGMEMTSKLLSSR